MNNVDKIRVVGSILPPECTNLGQRYIVFDWYGIIGTLTATDYKTPKFVLISKSKEKTEHE